MLKNIRKFFINDDELDIDCQKILSLIFLLLAGSMSFLKYGHSGFFRYITPESSFAPDYISGIIGIIAVSPLYLRNILKWNRSVYSIFSFILILVIFSSFIKLSTGGSNNTLIYSLIAVSIALSWLGIKGIAGISWILLLAAAVYSVISNNFNMGFPGFIYVLFGFLGLLMHTGLNPGGLFKELKDEYSKSFVYSTNIIKDEISATGEII